MPAQGDLHQRGNVDNEEPITLAWNSIRRVLETSAMLYWPEDEDWGSDGEDDKALEAERESSAQYKAYFAFPRKVLAVARSNSGDLVMDYTVYTSTIVRSVRP